MLICWATKKGIDEEKFAKYKLINYLTLSQINHIFVKI